jgi:hypothetical protein
VDWATFQLPPHAQAPALRDSLTKVAGFEVQDVGPGSVRLRPGEGAGVVTDHLRAYRLLNRSTALRPETWEPLLRNPRREYEYKDPAAAQAEVERRAGLGSIEGELSAMSLALLVLRSAEIVGFLESQLKGLFTAFPEASLWLIAADDILLGRLSFAHVAFQFAVTPDLRMGDRTLPYRRSLQSQSITRGVNFAEALAPLFLIFSPTSTGIAMSWAPHALVIDFGGRMELRRKPPLSRSALYEPQLLGFSVDQPGVNFGDGLASGELASLLSWWVARLNAIYSFAADPTRFVDGLGNYHPASQLGWWLTVERLMADLRLLGASPQGSQLARLQTAFDLLDKAEVLLGYGRGDSGKGFERLLRRSVMLPLLERAWRRLPLQLQSRFVAHSRLLFNRVYDEIIDHVLPHRTTKAAVKLGRVKPLRARPFDTYVPELVRAVRNSSHGLVDQLSGSDLDLVATHDATMPSVLPDLVALIVYALIADFERVREGTWWA